MNDLYKIPTHCRFCNSRHTAFVRNVPMRRMKENLPLYFCMECESFWHPKVYEEPDDQLQRDADWHITVEERNTIWANNFLDAALHKQPIQSILEIGCGTGTLLSVAKEKGIKIAGYDTNKYVVPIAKERHDVDVNCSIWTPESLNEKYDLVVCISTVEHLEQPQLLLRDISKYCQQWNSKAFISVPFMVERQDWHYLLEEIPQEISNPLYLCDVHINHFSRKGFEQMAHACGATEVEFFPRGWLGYWLSF